MIDSVESLNKYLKLNHPCKRITSNTLTVTPPDDDGQVRMDVIANFFPQRLQLYSRKAQTSAALDQICIHIIFHYGYYQIITDQNSDIMSIALNTMNKWLSVGHLISLVGRHENIRVKTTNKYLQHLRTLVYDELNDQTKRK